MTNEHQQRRAMSAAHERHLEPPDDMEEGSGTCKVCGGETYNGEQDSDGERLTWSWMPCDTCKEPCSECGDTKTVKTTNNLCADCAANKATEDAQ